jgi:hypothetical protein
VDDVSTAVKAIPEKDEHPSRMIKTATLIAVIKLVVVGIFMMDYLKELATDTISRFFL